MLGIGHRIPGSDRLLTQLVMALIAPTLLVGVLVGASLAESRRAALLAQEQRRAVQVAESAAVLFSERLRTGTQLINLLADRQALLSEGRMLDRAAIHTDLAARLPDTPFDCLALFDPAGSVVAQSGVCTPRLNTADGVVFRAIPHVGLVAQIGTSFVAGNESRFRLVGELALDRSLVDAARRQPDLEFGVGVGDTLVSSSLADRTGAPIPVQLPDAPMELRIGEQTFLAYYAPLPHSGDGMVASTEVLLPLAPIHAAQLNATMIIVVGVLIAVVLAVALGWVMARRISRPIDRLGMAAAAIGTGDLTQPVCVGGPAEIRHLSAIIEQMRVQLAGSRRELEQEKQQYFDILESITEAVLTLDPQSRVTSINHGAEVMFGVARTQTDGMALHDLLPPSDGSILSPATLARHGSMRIAVRTAASTTLTVSVTCAPQQGASGHILVLRDVSDDAALRRLKDAFLANITHELRTPLAAQIASLEILRDEADLLTPQEREQMLDALQSGVQRLDLLVQNLLDSAGIEAGHFRVEPERCRIAPLVDEAVALIQPLVRRRKQTITVQIDEQLPDISADGRRLVQVLVNLLANAAKFGPIGDTIELAVSFAEQGWVQIAVRDHGPGFPPERRDRLFERFLRPGAETLRSQGAGLGLAIVKAIIDRHGGRVTAEPAAAGGAIVTVLLPGWVSEETHENTAG